MFADVYHAFDDLPEDERFKFLHRNLLGLVDFANRLSQRYGALNDEHLKLEATVKELTKTVEALQREKV